VGSRFKPFLIAIRRTDLPDGAQVKSLRLEHVNFRRLQGGRGQPAVSGVQTRFRPGEGHPRASEVVHFANVEYDAFPLRCASGPSIISRGSVFILHPLSRSGNPIRENPAFKSLVRTFRDSDLHADEFIWEEV
jgi:hypothetical protein